MRTSLKEAYSNGLEENRIFIYSFVDEYSKSGKRRRNIFHIQIELNSISALIGEQ